jgi:uncharacterized protein
MPTSRAQVVTDRPDRYAKQLTEHLGRRNAPVAEPDGVRLVFARGSCLMAPGSGHLLLTASAEDDDGLSAVEELVARHLERIGRRDALAVGWVREQGGR